MKKTLLPAIALFLSLCSLAQIPAPLQLIKNTPPGEEVELFSGETHIPQFERRQMKVTTKAIYSSSDYTGPGSTGSNGLTEIYTAPHGTDIVDARFKFVTSGLLVGNGHNILVLLSDGRVVQLELSQGKYEPYFLNNIPKTTGGTPLQLIGDDLYAMTYNAVYVSDSGYNWAIDTAGLGNPFAYYDIDLDSNQKVWLSCSNGLFSQLLNVTTWTKNPNFGPSTTDYVFVDRNQNIWVSYFNNLQVSRDGGLTFQTAPSGLFNGYIRDIADDNFGNIYVLWDNRLYYSQNGTQAFVRIDLPVMADFALYSSTNVYNDIFGDSSIYLCTDAGVYTSANQGGTWTNADNVKAEHINTVSATADKRLLMTTNTGLFRKDNDSTWNKRYPTTGFVPGTRAFTAINGDIYLLAQKTGVNSSGVAVHMVYKSTDNGNSFIPDTLGAKAADVSLNRFFTDESGTQHAASVVFGGNNLLVWKKLPGQAWTTDIAGLPTMDFNNFVHCIGSDNNGKVYIAISKNGITTVYSRPIAGGSWGNELVINGTVQNIKGRAGIATIASVAGVSYNSGSGWQTIPRPAGVSASIDWCLSEVDKNGVVWAYYETFTNASTGQGIYFTKNLSTWTRAAGSPDTILFGELFALGDSVFATTAGQDGVYVFDTSSTIVSGLKEILEEKSTLILSPNPAGNNITLTLDEKIKGGLICITDITGKVLHQSTTQQRQTIIPTSQFANGIFLLSLTEENGKTYWQKFVIQK